MRRHFFQLYFLIIPLLCTPLNVQAVQWQPLVGTQRYNIAYDEQSIRLTPLGRLEVWLRFIPKGEAERKSAATEYKEKRYRSHLEYYEIDCSEQTALLGLIDILGTSRARLKRLRGGSQPDPILPGSVLDNASQRICPVLDENAEDESESTGAVQADEPEDLNDKTVSNDKQQEIEILLKKATAKGATAETWKELGNIYFDTDQPLEAINAYQQALNLNPKDTDCLNDQGAMYRQRGDFVRALANFEKAYSIDEFNLESIYNSGYVYAFDLHNIPKALVMWRRYIALDSKSETAQQVKSFIDQYGK